MIHVSLRGLMYENSLRVVKRRCINLSYGRFAVVVRIRDNDKSSRFDTRSSHALRVFNFDCLQNFVSLADLQLLFVGITNDRSCSRCPRRYPSFFLSEDIDIGIKALYFKKSIFEVNSLEVCVPEVIQSSVLLCPSLIKCVSFN